LISKWAAGIRPAAQQINPYQCDGVPLQKMKIRLSIPLLTFFISSTIVVAQPAKRPFTVEDDIRLETFVGESLRPDALFSPDVDFVGVYGRRGLLEVNRPENSLRIYQTRDIVNAMEHPQLPPPAPVWVITRSTESEGPIIHNWRWLPDSSGVVFLQRGDGGNYRIVLADVRKQTVEYLTPATTRIGEYANFDVRDRYHYIYEAVGEAEWKAHEKKTEAEHRGRMIVGTGRDIDELILPDDPVTEKISAPKSHLWAVRGGQPFEIKLNGAPLTADGVPALSPDGRFLLTKQSVAEVPKSWETLYPPPFPASHDRIHEGQNTASQYVLIDLQTGSVKALTGAPTAEDGGWNAAVFGHPSWSNNGQAVLLPGTFISGNNPPSRPCLAVVDIPSAKASCVEELKGRTEDGVEDGYHTIWSLQFFNGDPQRVLVSSSKKGEGWLSLESVLYQLSAAGLWQESGRFQGIPGYGHDHLELAIRQSFSEPPLLVASEGSKSRVIWDPNPQLKDIEFPSGSVYEWKDSQGRKFKGGLFRPTNYKRGRRYPLLIQTHGFENVFFLPDGPGFGTFAAAELASAGMFVLQVSEDCPGVLDVTPEEAPCAASAYESAARQLVADGLVDEESVGIAGFSRSCMYVMEALTSGSFHFKAALVIDGIMLDYLEYIVWPAMAGESDKMIGARPFGEGLQQWFKRSQGFKFDRINAPLMVVGEGAVSTLIMWHPYAVLHHLNKPVDLIMLNTDEHMITNPAMRLVAQGNTLDWFRFWLQGYEDPDPAKAEQYKRWRELKKLQAKTERSHNSVPGGGN
jgi:hypothetical protein